MLADGDGNTPDAGASGVESALNVVVRDSLNAVSDAARLPELFDTWASQIFRLGPAASEAMTMKLQENFLTTFNTLAQNAPEDRTLNAQVARIKASVRPTLVVTTDGRIHAQNDAGAARFGLSPGDSVPKDMLDEKSWALFKQFLHEVAEDMAHASPRRYLKLNDADDNLAVVDVQESRFSNDDPPVVLMRSFEIALSGKDYEALQDAFSLTDTEIDILKLMMQGDAVGDIAEKRQTAKPTVQTQIKTIRQKTLTKSQGELMLMVGGLAGIADEGEDDVYTMPFLHRMMTLPDGRKVQYQQIGPDGGKAIVIIHGALFGAAVPRAMTDPLVAAGYTIHIPIRRGYGLSEPVEDPESIDDDIGDIRDYLDAQGVEDFAIIASGSAMYLAAGLAARLSNRTRAMIGVSGYMPVSMKELYNTMSAWQRTVMHAVGFSPRLTAFYNTLGRRMMQSMELEDFYIKTYSNSPSDMAMAKDPNVRRLLKISYDLALAQNPLPITRDFRLVSGDWVDMMSQVRAPLTMIHGDEHQVIDISSVEGYCAEHDVGVVKRISGGGQTLAYSHPELVAGHILSALADS